MNIIKRFDKYFSKIEESLNSPQLVKWENDNDDKLFGHFKVDDIEYKIECIKQIGPNWSYTFSYFDINKNIWSYEISHKGTGGLNVLSTVKTELYTFYIKYNPNSIIFSAIDDSDTRKRLYQNFCEKFCNINNLKFSNRGNDEYRMFVMFKKELSETELEEIFQSEIGK